MMRQLQRRGAAPNSMGFAYAGYEPRLGVCHRSSAITNLTPKFPRRPDASVINESIPLFYIGRNRNGLWVAREAEGRTGGIFLSQRSALRFAKECNENTGCATMFVAEPLELDIEKRGRFAGSSHVEEHRPPHFAGIVTAIDAMRRILAWLSRALAGARAHRQAIERELFRGQYTLCSKSDDDLPVVR